MTGFERLYRAACLHIEVFGLELERDGLTTTLSDPEHGIVLWARGIRKRHLVCELVTQHVTHMSRLADQASYRRDLELLDG